MSLHDLLDDVARTAPPVDALRSADEAWGTAGRRRRRSWVVAGAAVVGLVVVTVLVGASIARPAPKPLPGTVELAPSQGLPSGIYRVNPWLQTIGEDPAPPLAYLFAAPGLDDRLVGVSVDGSYRYLPSGPGPAGYELTGMTLSPDGRRLALAWSTGGTGESRGQIRAQVLAYDVTTGKTLGPWVGNSLGDLISHLAWRADGEAIAWQDTTADGVDVPGSPGSTSVRVLELSGGGVTLPDVGGPLAWSPEGGRLLAAAASGDPVVVPAQGGTATAVDVPKGTVFGTAAWSADGSEVAGLVCAGFEPNGACVRTAGAGLVRVRPGGQPTVKYSSSYEVPPIGAVVGWRTGQPVIGMSDGNAVRLGLSDDTFLFPNTMEMHVHEFQVAPGLVAAQPFLELPPPASSDTSAVALKWRLTHLTGFAALLPWIVTLGVLAFVTGVVAWARRTASR